MPVRRPTTVLAVALSAAGLLAACTGTPGAPKPTPSDTPTAAPLPAEPVTRTVVIAGDEVPLEVGPVAVHGDVAVLRLAAPTDAPFLSMTLWEVFESISSPGPNGVRLVDTEAGTVSPPVRDVDGTPVTTRNFNPGGPATDAAQEAAGEDVEIVYAAFTAPEGRTVDVMLPDGGWVADVPVVPADAAGELTVPPTELTDDGITDPLVLPLEAYTEQAGGQVRARQTPEQVTVQVASDVLFAVDSDQLGPEAEAALAAAGAEVAGYPGGRLTVVGHTDDVAADDYNLDLSRRRAATVAARLGQVVDLSAFDVTVDGRGESEPAVAGTSAEERALNRRVEIVLLPDGAREDEAVAVAGGVPDPLGPSAAGPQGVTIQDRDDTYAIRLPEVRRDGRYLVGELEVTHVAGESASVTGILASGVKDVRGEFDASLIYAATNVTLLTGDRRTYPLDYLRNAEREIREPLADRTISEIEIGATRTVTVVWPDPGTDTVTVDVTPRTGRNGPGGEPAFRLTDVPVIEG